MSNTETKDASTQIMEMADHYARIRCSLHSGGGADAVARGDQARRDLQEVVDSMTSLLAADGDRLDWWTEKSPEISRLDDCINVTWWDGKDLYSHTGTTLRQAIDSGKKQSPITKKKD